MQTQAQEQLGTQPIEARIPGPEFVRGIRVTRHAIDQMIERTKDWGIDWTAARGIAALGDTIDLLVQEGRGRGASSKWWEIPPDAAYDDERQVEIVKLDLGAGREPLHALIVDNDAANPRHPDAVLTLLYDRQFNNSVRSLRFTKERRRPPNKLVAFGDQLAVAIGSAAPVQVTTDEPLPTAFELPPRAVPDTLPTHAARIGDRDTKPSNAPQPEQHVAEVAGHGRAADVGALIVYQDPGGGDTAPSDRTMQVRDWADVPGVVADLVDGGIAIESIATYRFVPLRVKRSITITLGD